MDATQEHLSEDLLKSEATLRAVLETAVDGIITIDEKGTILSFNRAAETIFGYTQQEVVGRNVNCLMPSPYREEHDGYIANFLRTGDAKIIGIGREVVGLRKDRTHFPMDLAVSQVEIEGEIIFAGIVRDVTERKQAETELERRNSALRKSASMMRSILTTAVDGVITINERGAILSFNNAAETIFGYEQAEVIGRNVNCLMPSPYTAEHDDYIANFLRTGEAKIIGIGREVVGLRKDGARFPMDLAVSQVEIEGEIIFTGIVRDVTERKQAETDLKTKNAELDEFTYAASHDLQEPLRKLVSFSKLLETDIGSDLSEKARMDLGFITDAACRMQTLVQDLLKLSRAGRGAVAYKKIDLNECVDVAIKFLSVRIEETKAQFIRDDLPIVYGDRTLLTQLYQNLVCNALKFMPSGQEPRIQLTAEQIEGKWVFGVRDNGIGIKSEYLEQIFAPFKRLHGRSEFEGTGIGLAVCRKAVERHSGSIWVESEPGEGAHFKFTILGKKEFSKCETREADPSLSC